MPRLEQHSNNIIKIYKILSVLIHELLKGSWMGRSDKVSLKCEK